MTTIKTTAGLAAVAALALPAGAAIAKDPPPGQQKSQQRHERNAAAKAQPKAEHPKHTARCDHTVGFKLAGTGLDAGGLTLTDGKATGKLTLDVLRANRHARRFLQITKLPANDETLTLSDDALKLRLVDVNGLGDVKPTDRVNVVGRVTKPRKNCATTTQSLDVRKITIIRRTEEQH